MSTYQEEKDRLEELGKAHEVATKAAAEVAAFVKRHPEVKDVHANYSIIYSYFHGDLEDISENTLEDCWLNHGDRFRKSLACYPSEAHERDALEKRIVQLMSQGNSPNALANVKAGFRFKNLDQLRAQKDELEARAEMRSKSPAELRAAIQAARPNPEQELPVDISREQILHLWNADQFRFWAKKVGMNAITKRISEGRN
jgi:hypothetical protein